MRTRRMMRDGVARSVTSKQSAEWPRTYFTFPILFSVLCNMFLGLAILYFIVYTVALCAEGGWFTEGADGVFVMQ